MPARARSATASFDKLYRKLLNNQAAVAAALRRRRRDWYKIDGVIGYGVGGAYPDVTAVFALDRTHPAVRAGRAQRRLPKSIPVGRQRVRTEIIQLGKPRLLTADIGDPTENRRNHRTAGSGTWPMGVALQVFPAGGGTPQVGTAGCIVTRRADSDPKPPCVLTVRHLTMAPGNDVAQWERNRDPTTGQRHNFAATTGPVSADPQIDAGLIIEPAGAESRILHVGAPKAAKQVTPGMHVRKSGAATGLTYGTVLAVLEEMQLASQPPVTYKRFIMVRNACPQQPPRPGVLPPGTPTDRFAWQGDSGALVVLGLPVAGVFGSEALDTQFGLGSDAERQAILDEYDGAAVGLLVLVTDAQITVAGQTRTLDVAWAHEIQSVLTTLQVNLVA